MPEYSRGKIYKIVCNVTGLIYVGSTCEPTLARRLAKHVGGFRQWKNGKTNYITSFKIIEKDNYDIVLIENCPCDTKDELHKRERYYIENLECVNKVIIGRSKKESDKNYREKNKEKISVYYQENKEILNEKMRKYYIENKEFVQKLNKEYREKHKEELKVSKRAYRQANIEKIHEQKNRVCMCECGRTYTHSNKSQHLKSKIHQDFINNIQNKV